LDEKPGFKSYIKQFSVVSNTVKDMDTGILYEEINAKKHRILWALLFILAYGAITYFLITVLPAVTDALIGAVYIVSAILAAAAYYVFSVWAVLRISSFDALGEEEVNKFIGTNNDIF
jgi:hypothetical protein